MIPYPRSESTSGATPGIRIIGLGNAGVHLADRLITAGHSSVDVVVMNTDTQSLTSSVAPQKISLGEKTARGLGTGGDPELGYEAAQESLEEIRSAVEGAGVLFLCAGLGGGTGSGAAPLLAECAREAGATVFSIVSSPFSFEGKRRATQAAEALAALSRHSSAVIHFENDRMAELAAPRAGIEETFAAADAMFGACIFSLSEMLQGGVPMPVSLADLLAATSGGGPAALFGRGESDGDNRAHEALERALKSPLLDRGRLVENCHVLVVHISGPSSLSFSEVAAIMRELDRHTADHARLFLGVTTCEEAVAPLSVTLLGNYAGTIKEQPVPAAPPAATVHREKAPVAEKPSPPPAPKEDPKPLFPEGSSPEPEKPATPAVRASREPAAKPAPPKIKQETLQFESVARGRFEKSEPTIVEGEDLDVPTFLRMRGKTK